MPLIRKCTRCRTLLLWPVVVDGKCFCSPECRALYERPEILKELPPFDSVAVRARASVLLVISLAICAGLIWYRSTKMQWQKGGEVLFVLPFLFVIEILTGAPIWHSNLVFQSFPGWKRALIVLGILIFGIAELAGGFALYSSLM